MSRPAHRRRCATGASFFAAVLLLSVDSVLAEDPAKSDATEAAPWNVYDGGWASAQFVVGVLLDTTRYSPDDEIISQLGTDLSEFETGEVRAVRLGVGGTFKLPHPVNYVVGGAVRAWDRGFDTDTSDDFTLFDVALSTRIPKVGRLTVGKMKEPISLERVMSLAYEPFLERPIGLDALLPSRNVGIRLSDTAVDRRMTWSVGWFNDWIDSGESFSESSEQYIGRVTGLAWVNEEESNLLHLGLALRYSDTEAGIVRFKTTPEAFFSPEFVDTDDVPADGAMWVSLETSWQRGPLWLAGEYLHTDVDSDSTGDPTFRAYHVSASWVLTGEHRGYDRRRGIPGALTPARPVRGRGAGLWEVAVRYSDLDLTDGSVEGGELSRASAAISWYLSRAARVELNYGRVELDRFGTVGETNVVQFRWQMLLE